MTNLQHFAEVWVTITDYPSYQISNKGKIRHSVFKKNLKPWKCTGGYFKITFSLGRGKRQVKSMHRLMAEQFIPNPFRKPLVNHIDKDRSNYVLSNLEWMTASENMVHAYQHIVKKEKQTLSTYNNKSIAIYYKGKYQSTETNMKSAALLINIPYYTVWRCIRDEAVIVRGKGKWFSFKEVDYESPVIKKPALNYCNICTYHLWF